jgi:hypothetical protein
MKKALLLAGVVVISGCATIVNDPMVPISLSFSDGSSGKCVLANKRGTWSVDIPVIASVRRSDDALKMECETNDGRKANVQIESEMGAEIVASAVFFDLGITDAITDKHRKYTASFVVPVVARAP